MNEVKKSTKYFSERMNGEAKYAIKRMERCLAAICYNTSYAFQNYESNRQFRVSFCRRAYSFIFRCNRQIRLVVAIHRILTI